MSHHSMKIAMAALACAATGAGAAEFGTVVSSTPVVASVPVVQRQCADEPVAQPQRSGGAGALLGAVVGAAIGNTFGAGSGRAAATGLGMIAGAALGNAADTEASAPAATAQRCRDLTRYEQRTVGYDVVYDYQGVRRSVRLAQDPGDRIALDIQVVPAGAQAPARRPVAPPAPVYRSPADLPYDDEAPPPPPRVVYAPQPVTYAAPPPVYLNPLPYIIIGGAAAWYATQGHGHHWGGRGYRR